MSFNKTTQVSNTGLGDDQYAQLQTNQSGLGTQIQEGFGSVDTGISNLSSDVSNVSTGLSGLTNTANTGFENVNTGLEQLGYNMITANNISEANRNTAFNDLIGRMNSNAGGLQTSLDAGFADAGTRFDTLDNSVGDVQTSVDTGFQNTSDQMTEGFTEAGNRFDTLDSNVGTVQSDVETGFNDANTKLNNLGSDVNTAQTTITQGQGEIQNSLGDLSSNQDIYATSSLENQANLQSGQDQFSSNFDDFLNRYGDDTTLAQKSRADLAQANATGNQKIREDLATFGSGLDQGFASIQSGQDANQNETMSELNNMSAGASADQNQTMQQFKNLDAGQVLQLRDIASVAANQEGLDEEMRNDFNQLGKAYDDNGNLIQNSIDQQGNTVTRALDNQGNMLLNSFDVTGQKLGSKVIDVGTRVNQLSQFSQAAMGNLTPANSENTAMSGSSPYARTG